MNEQAPFTGLKVLDIASYIAGPAAATLLGDFGASVIKVEPPGSGDPYRQVHKVPPHPACETDYAWQLTNRNKRGIVLDLKQPESRLVLRRLVEWADVLITNYPQPVRKALGLSYEDVAPWNQRLVYADVSGFGDRGPRAAQPGFDVTAFWAGTGHMEVTRDAGCPPALPIPGIGDHATATALYAAIVTALLRRERTGKGGRVSTSLMAVGAWSAGIWLQAALHQACFHGQQDRTRPDNALFNSYRTADDRWLLLAVMNERLWPALASALGRPELASDGRFVDGSSRAKHADALAALLDAAFCSQPLEHWERLLAQARIPYSAVKSAQELAGDPQLLSNQALVPLACSSGVATHTVGSPIEVAGVAKAAAGSAPALGEHTDEVLRELGLMRDEAIPPRSAEMQI